MSRRGRLVLAAVVALVAAAAVAFLVLGGDEPPALEAATSYDELGGREEPGATVANALTYMHNRGDEPIVLEGARILGSSVPPVRFLVAGADRTDDVQGGVDAQCPPPYFKPGSVKALRGFSLPPDTTEKGKQGAVLIFCLTAPKAPARVRMAELELTYRQDGERRTLTIPNRFTICVDTRARCEAESESEETF